MDSLVLLGGNNLFTIEYIYIYKYINIARSIEHDSRCLPLRLNLHTHTYIRHISLIVVFVSFVFPSCV